MLSHLSKPRTAQGRGGEADSLLVSGSLKFREFCAYVHRGFSSGIYFQTPLLLDSSLSQVKNLDAEKRVSLPRFICKARSRQDLHLYHGMLLLEQGL